MIVLYLSQANWCAMYLEMMVSYTKEVQLPNLPEVKLKVSILLHALDNIVNQPSTASHRKNRSDL